MLTVPRLILRTTLRLLSQPALLAQWALYLFLCYLAFYFAASSLLWFTIMQQQGKNAPPVALTWYSEPFGLGLRSAEAQMDIAGVPAKLEDMNLIWPIDAPWGIIIRAARTEAEIDTVQLGAAQFSIASRIALPWTRAVKITAQSVAITDAGAPAGAGAVLVDMPKLEFVRRYVNTGADDGAAEIWRFTTGSIIAPLPHNANALQIEGVKLGVNVSRVQPDWNNREAVAAWQAKGSRIELVEASAKALDLDMSANGDVRLKDDLGLTGEIQLQVGGLARGYMRMAEMGLLEPQQQQILGELLRLMPDAGARTYDLPVRFKGDVVYVGEGPVWRFGTMPWETVK